MPTYSGFYLQRPTKICGLSNAFSAAEELQPIPHTFRLANACKLPDSDERYHCIVETFGVQTLNSQIRVTRQTSWVSAQHTPDELPFSQHVDLGFM